MLRTRISIPIPYRSKRLVLFRKTDPSEELFPIRDSYVPFSEKNDKNMLRFFWSSDLDFAKRKALWIVAVRQYASLYRVQDAVAMIGDVVKYAKEGRLLQ